VHLIICSLRELVFRLCIPDLRIKGSRKITAKKDLKKIICDKLKSSDKYLTNVLSSAKFIDAKSIQIPDLILEDITFIYII
jgi:hypothetical protein